MMIRENTFGPVQNGYPIADDIFKCNLLNANYMYCTLIQMSLKFVPECAVDNESALVKFGTWHYDDVTMGAIAFLITSLTIV